MEPTIFRLLALSMALLLLVPLCACGEKGEDVTGSYNCVSATFADGSGSPDGEWLKLEKGGKGTFFSGYEFGLKWTLKGEDFSGTVSFLGMEQELVGTLKDGVLNASYGDIQYVFVKEGVELPTADNDAEPEQASASSSAWGKDKTGGKAQAAQPDPAAQPASGSLAGKYMISRLESGGATLSINDLRNAKMDDWYLLLNEDGSGELYMSGVTTPITWDEESIFYGSSRSYTVDGDKIILDMDATVMTFTREESGAASNASDGWLGSGSD